MNTQRNTISNPQRVLLPILEKIKRVYILWHTFHIILPQSHRYTLGNRIDKLLIELIESISTAIFLHKEEKLPFIRLAIRKLDTVKILVLILWETNSITDKNYIMLSEYFEEIGKMLGGWNGQVVKFQNIHKKENSPQ